MCRSPGTISKALLTAPNRQLENHDDTKHAPDIQQNVKQISGSQGLIDSKQLDEMVWSDEDLHGSEQHFVNHLDKIMRDFKNQGERFRLSPRQLQEHCHSFHAAATKYLVQGNITEAAVIAKFIYALPQGLTVKAMRIASRLRWRSFQEVYTSIMASLNLSLETFQVDIDGVILSLQGLHI
ncbi:hypothetical protein IFR05_015995 [Cadophora sp. M221]|nr:hypothetical protein IFR05_015995 [Cadophora sp. M221]